MKTRLAAIAAALAVALAVTSAVLIGVNYIGLNADLARANEVQPSPSSSPVPAAAPSPQTAPDDEITPEQIDDERLHAIEWVEWQALIDDCMAAAGFEEYTYSDDMTFTLFPESYTSTERAAASLAFGGNPGVAADYRWEDAGCSGAATHELGIGS